MRKKNNEKIKSSEKSGDKKTNNKETQEKKSIAV